MNLMSAILLASIICTNGWLMHWKSIGNVTLHTLTTEYNQLILLKTNIKTHASAMNLCRILIYISFLQTLVQYCWDSKMYLSLHIQNRSLGVSPILYVYNILHRKYINFIAYTGAKDIVNNITRNIAMFPYKASLWCA